MIMKKISRIDWKEVGPPRPCPFLLSARWAVSPADVNLIRNNIARDFRLKKLTIFTKIF